MTTAGVSVKRDKGATLRASDRLKLSTAVRGRSERQALFFELNGKIGQDSKAVYDLHMSIDTFSKSLTYYDMMDVFRLFLPQRFQL